MARGGVSGLERLPLERHPSPSPFTAMLFRLAAAGVRLSSGSVSRENKEGLFVDEAEDEHVEEEKVEDADEDKALEGDVLHYSGAPSQENEADSFVEEAEGKEAKKEKVEEAAFKNLEIEW